MQLVYWARRQDTLIPVQSLAQTCRANLVVTPTFSVSQFPHKQREVFRTRSFWCLKLTPRYG